MENLVPLGTGNSRFMKSNIPASTTLAQLIQMLNNGTFPYDIGPLNSAGISQQGTPLNKASLLKDSTAALYGLGTDAVPDDVLSILSKAALVTGGSLFGVNGDPVGPQIETGSYVGTGTSGSSSPNVLSFSRKPAIVVVYMDGIKGLLPSFNDTKPSWFYSFIWVRGQSQTDVRTDSYMTLSFSYNDGKDLSWFASGAYPTGIRQLNEAGKTYHYAGLCI